MLKTLNTTKKKNWLEKQNYSHGKMNILLIKSRQQTRQMCAKETQVSFWKFHEGAAKGHFVVNITTKNILNARH